MPWSVIMPNEAADRSSCSSTLTAAAGPAGMAVRDIAQEAAEQLDLDDHEVFMLQPARRRTSCSSASSDSSNCDEGGNVEASQPAASGGTYLQRPVQRGSTIMALARPSSTTTAAVNANRRGKASQQQNSRPADSSQYVYNRQQLASSQLDTFKPQGNRKQQRQQQRPSHPDHHQQQYVQPKQQVVSLEEQQQGVLLPVCKLCQRPETSCERRSCSGYCRNCKKRGHLTIKCRKLAATPAAPQPPAETTASSNRSTTVAATMQYCKNIRPELLLHKATALHALQQIVSNAALRQQLRAAIQAAGRQQVVAAVCQQLQKISADVAADADELSSEDLEQLVSFAELAAAAQQLPQHVAVTQQKQPPAANDRAPPAAVPAAASVLPTSKSRTAAVAGSRTVVKVVKRRGLTPAADWQPKHMLQLPEQSPVATSVETTTAAPPPPPAATTAAAVPSQPVAAHRAPLPPPPPPPRLAASRAAAQPVITPSSATDLGSKCLPGHAAAAAAAVLSHTPQQEQQQTGLQPPHPLYAGVRTLAVGTTAAAAAAAAGQPPAAVDSVAAAWPGQVQVPKVPVKLTGPLQPWMLMCKPGAERAVYELVQQDCIVQAHLLHLISNTADWQLVTVLSEELEFLLQLLGAGRLRLEDVEGVRRLTHLLGQARHHQGPIAAQHHPSSLLPASHHDAAGLPAPAGSVAAGQQFGAPPVPDACRQM